MKRGEDFIENLTVDDLSEGLVDFILVSEKEKERLEIRNRLLPHKNQLFITKYYEKINKLSEDKKAASEQKKKELEGKEEGACSGKLFLEGKVLSDK